MKTLNNNNNGYLKLIASILTLEIFITGFSGCQRVENVDGKPDNSVSEVDSKDLFRQLCNSTDVSNIEAFELVKDYIIDYGKYMNSADLIKSAKDLKIVYKNLDMEQTGYYNKKSNTIVINDRINGDSNGVLFHEMEHFLSNGGTGIKTLDEGITQETRNEYYGRETGIYSKEVAYTNALTEIVGKDVMQKTYLSGDLELLINRLERYTSRADADTLIKCIDSAMSFYSSYTETGYQSDYNNYEACNAVVWVIMDSILISKLGINVADSEIFSAYWSITTGENHTNKPNVNRIYVSKDYYVGEKDTGKINYYFKNGYTSVESEPINGKVNTKKRS